MSTFAQALPLSTTLVSFTDMVEVADLNKQQRLALISSFEAAETEGVVAYDSNMMKSEFMEAFHEEKQRRLSPKS